MSFQRRTRDIHAITRAMEKLVQQFNGKTEFTKDDVDIIERVLREEGINNFDLGTMLIILKHEIHNYEVEKYENMPMQVIIHLANGNHVEVGIKRKDVDKIREDIIDKKRVFVEDAMGSQFIIDAAHVSIFEVNEYEKRV